MHKNSKIWTRPRAADRVAAGVQICQCSAVSHITYMASYPINSKVFGLAKQAFEKPLFCATRQVRRSERGYLVAGLFALSSAAEVTPALSRDESVMSLMFYGSGMGKVFRIIFTLCSC